MTALSADRKTPQRDGVDSVHPLAASTTIYAGSMVALDASGDAKPATKAADTVIIVDLSALTAWQKPTCAICWVR